MKKFRVKHVTKAIWGLAKILFGDNYAILIIQSETFNIFFEKEHEKEQSKMP